MKYEDIVPGIFLRRLNRFVAEVSVDGEVQRAHVRNTGRCTCVLHTGLEVSLQRSRDPGRSTPYTLIAVDSADYGWVNLDSLAPNKLAGEWLAAQGFTSIKTSTPNAAQSAGWWRSRAAPRRRTASGNSRTRPRSAAQSTSGNFPEPSREDSAR